MTRGKIAAATTVDATLTFLGAAGEVTGSSFLVETAGLRFLVDCGMFQGQESDRKNAEALAFDVRAIDFVILTHAHTDHSDCFRGSRAAASAGRSMRRPRPATCWG